MNQLKLRTTVGTIIISWKTTGLLASIDWLPQTVSEDSSTSLIGSYQGRIPPTVIRLVDSFQGYFEAGDPIEWIPWDGIDQSEWSEFQRDIYRAIVAIPHGETRTYAWTAHRIGKPAATRAVGQALKKNPLPVLIPCHRVVAANALGGFMGHSDPQEPEIQLKRRLIELEETYRNPVFSFLSA